MARIEVVITTVGGDVVYREEADNEISFTGHLSDGSLIKSGMYFYRCDMQGLDKPDTGYFLITHYDDKVYLAMVGFGTKEIPKEPSPSMSIIKCEINTEMDDIGKIYSLVDC